MVTRKEIASLAEKGPVRLAFRDETRSVVPSGAHFWIDPDGDTLVLRDSNRVLVVTELREVTSVEPAGRR